MSQYTPEILFCLGFVVLIAVSAYLIVRRPEQVRRLRGKVDYWRGMYDRATMECTSERARVLDAWECYHLAQERAESTLRRRDTEIVALKGERERIAYDRDELRDLVCYLVQNRDQTLAAYADLLDLYNERFDQAFPRDGEILSLDAGTLSASDRPAPDVTAEDQPSFTSFASAE